MLNLYDELAGLVRTFERQRIPYALCGGLALAVHGLARATVDIDILVPPEALDAAKEVARDLGYDLAAAPMSFAGGAVVIDRLSKIDADSGDLLSLDLVVVSPALEEVWAGRVHAQWEEGAIAVVSRDGLIAMKRLRASGRDLEDIVALGETPDAR